VESAKNAPNDSLKTFNEDYGGSQIFTIFDLDKYPQFRESLGNFLQNRNKGMYAIWSVRNEKEPGITLISD
jgi:hypothetical protein